MNRSVALLLLICAPPLHAQSTSQNRLPKTPPMEVELVRSLDSQTLHIGDEILGKLRSDWTDGVCTLPQSSVVHGIVREISDTRGKHSTLALDFRYSCHDLDPQKLTWLALLAPYQDTSDPSGHAVMRQLFHSPSFGEGGGLGSPGNTQANHVDMAGRQNATMPLSFQDGESDKQARRPAAVKTGLVWKLPRLKLAVGTGPDGSTVLSSPDKQVKLPLGAVLILLPESLALLPPVAGSISPVAPAITAPRPSIPLPPEIGVCAEPACTNLPTSIPRPENPPTLQTISLQHLGYHRLRSAEVRDLEFGAAVAFLGSDHLLFTFNPHTLISREVGDRPEDHPHMVRAILFNLKSGLAERTLDWRVRSDAQYLWALNGEQVLVHDGDRLRWFGSDLQEVHSFKLDGPLAFVKLSPDRRHYAVGVLRELHTGPEHADLAKADAGGPEEQLIIHLLDENLHELDHGVASSRSMPPLLLNDGRIELRRAQANQYYLREYPWSPEHPSRPGHQPGPEHRDFARMTSSCVPTANSLSANLILVEGCDGASLDHWYRVLREDGHPVLKGLVHWRELSPLTADDGQSGVFALTIPEAGGDYVREKAFHGADLSRETVYIHQASNGRQISELRLHRPLPAKQPTALSPGGDRLAVIDGEEIAIYPIPPPAPKP